MPCIVPPEVNKTPTSINVCRHFVIMSTISSVVFSLESSPPEADKHLEDLVPENIFEINNNYNIFKKFCLNRRIPFNQRS